MSGEAVAQDMHAHALVEPRRGRRRAAGRMQRRRLDRLVGRAAGKQEVWRPRQPPVAAQDAQQRLGQHHAALLAALAALDPHHHARAVDVADLQGGDFRNAQARRIGRRQRDPGLQARNGFKKLNDFVGAEHSGKLARLTGVGDPLRDRLFAERHTVEETQGADDLVQRRPRDALRSQMNLIGPNILQAEPIGRATEILTELRNRVDVGSLRRRRQIADRHVLNHPTTKRAHLAHLKTPV